jgi:hypothetical protein
MTWKFPTPRHALDRLRMNTHEFRRLFASQRTFNPGSFVVPVQISGKIGGVFPLSSCGSAFGFSKG